MLTFNFFANWLFPENNWDLKRYIMGNPQSVHTRTNSLYFHTEKRKEPHYKISRNRYCSLAECPEAKLRHLTAEHLYWPRDELITFSWGNWWLLRGVCQLSECSSDCESAHAMTSQACQSGSEFCTVSQKIPAGLLKKCCYFTMTIRYLMLTWIRPEREGGRRRKNSIMWALKWVTGGWVGSLFSFYCNRIYSFKSFKILKMNQWDTKWQMIL